MAKAKAPRKGLWIVKTKPKAKGTIIARISMRPDDDARKIARILFPEERFKLKWWYTTSDENRRIAKRGIPIYGVISQQIVGFPFTMGGKIVSMEEHKIGPQRYKAHHGN